MRALIIEDERKLNDTLRRALEGEGYIVHQSYDGREGLAAASSSDYDAIILDLALPGLDGYEVCRRLRRGGSQAPVLMLTARGAIDDRVQGLDCGADDYLVKPFALPELMARLRAILRRESRDHSPVLQVADLSLNTVTREVTRAGQRITLSSREYAVLEYFMRRKGQVLTRGMIAEHVWDYAFDPTSNVIDVYVRYLRLKIDAGFEPKLLHTLRGAGYKLSPEG